MKKALFCLLAVCSLTASAQVVEVRSITAVPVQHFNGSKVSVYQPVISPDGTCAVVNSCLDQSLFRIDLSVGSVSRLDIEGSAWDVSFTPDSKGIVFKTVITREDHLNYRFVQSYDFASGSHRRLTGEARHCAAFNVAPQSGLLIAESGRMRSVAISGRNAAVAPQRAIVDINLGHLEVTYPDGTVANIDPQGPGSYLWPALSPDGTKIAYYVVGGGCFVCNLDGSNAREIGYVHGPTWLDNNTIIGFQDYDDGQVVTSSTVVAANLSGTIQQLTEPSLLGMFPSATADAKTILFCTADGDLYTINLK